jgi:hypothetical protein
MKLCNTVVRKMVYSKALLGPVLRAESIAVALEKTARPEILAIATTSFRGLRFPIRKLAVLIIWAISSLVLLDCLCEEKI